MEPRRVALAAAVAVIGLVGTAFVYRVGGDVHVDFERGYEGAFVFGFHPRERAEGKYFRWTNGASFVDFHHLPSSGRIAVEMRLKTIRPQGLPLPNLVFSANGVTVHRAQALPGIVAYSFDFPSSGSRLRLGIESETFESGGRDLGVQVLGVRLDLPPEPPGWWAPAMYVALGGASFYLASGVVPALGILTGFLYLLSPDAVRFTTYPRQVALLSVVFLGLVVAGRFALDRIGWLERRDRAQVVLALALVLLGKLALLSYPLMLSSDADFQANRMNELLQGNWYPTSVTQHQPPFRIPYPVSLYAIAAPLAMAGIDRVVALEIVTAIFDTAVSAALVFLAWRFLDDLRAGLLAAILYQLVPVNALAFSAGNFTNLFGVAMLALAFTFLISERAVEAAGATVMALMAHFGVLLEGLLLFPLWLLAPGKARGRMAVAVASGFMVAGLYYLGYREIFIGQWGRDVSLQSGSLRATFSFLGDQLGWVFLLTALLGSVSFVRGGGTTRLQAGALAWLAVTLLFLAIDTFSAVEIRYALQALPVLALFSGSYLSRALDRGRLGKTAAVAAIIYLGAVGARLLHEIVLFRYH